MFTTEIVAKLRATYDRRRSAEAEIAQADADEVAINDLITACGYDAYELVEKAYNDED
jgi:hypothetical protein